MSTSEEVLEKTPGPLDIIETFESAHEAAIIAAANLQAGPSTETTEEFKLRIDALRQFVSPLFEATFFKESETPMLIDAGVGAMLNSAQHLSEATLELAPDESTVEITAFALDVREHLTEAIHTADISHFITILDSDSQSEPTEEQRYSILMDRFQLTYLEIVNGYESAVFNSEAMNNYVAELEAERQRISKILEGRIERAKQIKLVGTVMAAAFGGTLLANKFSRRR
jgi:hypothetical protein